QSCHQTEPCNHPRPSTCEVLGVAQQLIAARPLEVPTELLHPIGGDLSEMSDLLAVPLSLSQHLRSALAQHPSCLAGLPTDLCRTAVKRFAELSASLILQLDRLVLDV